MTHTNDRWHSCIVLFLKDAISMSKLRRALTKKEGFIYL